MNVFQEFRLSEVYEFRHGVDFIEKLKRIHCTKNADIEARKIMLKVSLQLKEDQVRLLKFPPVQELTEAEIANKAKKDKERDKKKDGGSGPKKAGEEEEVVKK